ncbi:MAG: glutamate--tRNA ligase [Candidatus Nealsonbacteria bacterium]|nr:glutamate--tRNA ligase [Candidatus Nealsonbacteria bacterium]
MTKEEFKFIRPGKVRVRIAPSPTGFLHIGSARTALFNYLFAKKHQGSFILRIEDTDIERSSPEFEKDILENLKWLGIQWSEGPDIGGEYEPYRQSERKNIYTKYLKKLLDENNAYYCFCSKEEIEAQKQYQMSIGEIPGYNGKCASLLTKEVKKYLSQEKESVIRIRNPLHIKKIVFNDLIRGRLEFDTGLMGDMIIAKNLLSPLYNFAVVIDDFEMKITHVIRGEEHISNTPKQILIQQALGIPKVEYTHLSLILAPDKSKLSKRHGAIPVAEYRKQGYLSETLVNFIAFLGWNPGTEREIFSMASLVKEFSLTKVQKAGAIFNVKRLDYLNGFYIRQKSIDRLTELCLAYFIEAGLIIKQDEKFKIKETKEEISLETLKKIISIYQERLKKLSEISELADFFFKEKLNYDKNRLIWKEMSIQEVKKSLLTSEKLLAKIKPDNWTKENIERVLMPEAEKAKDRGVLLWPLRVALTNKQASASPFEIAEILGKDKTIKRIKQSFESLCLKN